MQINFVAGEAKASSKTAVSVPVFEGGVLSPAAEAVDQATGGGVARAIAGGRFTGAKGQVLDLVAPTGLDVQRVILVGVGDKDAFDAQGAETFGADSFQAAKGSGAEVLRISLPAAPAEFPPRAAFGARLAAYRFDKYRTTEKPEKKPSVVAVEIAAHDPAAASAAFAPLSALADAVLFARDLVSEPANILHPEEFARRVKALESLGLEVEILGEAEMTKLGMGALLGVGQGSRRESQLAVVQWKGAADPKAPPVAFVGKGVCFDTGGISLKPADGMEDMKWDMGGAAAVAGVMHALAGRKAKVNAVGVLGLVENMPDGNAQRPGDVVTSMSGQTIEVINTDAEGRLVLADVIWHVQQTEKPKAIIDLATLTGAIIVALGQDIAGLFSNDDDLAGKITAAGEATAEKVWRMPLIPAYDKAIDSKFADMKNTGGRHGGAATAAAFIKRYVNDTPWAHLDIAGVGMSSTPNEINRSWGAGWGVRLLDRLIRDHYEAR